MDYEPVTLALSLKLVSLPSRQQRMEMLQRCSPEAMSRMLALLVPAIGNIHEELGRDDIEHFVTRIDDILAMLVSKLDTSGEPF